MDCDNRKRMGENEVRKLLERYFDGITTLGEEKALRDYFSGDGPVAPDLQYAKVIFGYFREASEQKGAPVCMEDIEKCAETSGQTDRGPHAHGRRPFGLMPRRLLYYAASTAAIAATVIALCLPPTGIRNEANDTAVYCYINGKPVTDMEQAMRYAADALDLLGESLRKPAEYLAPLGEFNRSLENIIHISEAGLSMAGKMTDK